MTTVLVYHSNNSGGYWWLTDQNWDNLAEAGWNVFWGNGGNRYSSDTAELLTPVPDTKDTWLGAKATACAKRVESAQAGVAEWEEVTGQSAAALGCNCCGSPHSFSTVDDDGNEDYITLEQPRVGRLRF